MNAPYIDREISELRSLMEEAIATNSRVLDVTMRLRGRTPLERETVLAEYRATEMARSQNALREFEALLYSNGVSDCGRVQ